jgi:hypothetical protein
MSIPMLFLSFIMFLIGLATKPTTSHHRTTPVLIIRRASLHEGPQKQQEKNRQGCLLFDISRVFHHVMQDPDNTFLIRLQ